VASTAPAAATGPSLTRGEGDVRINDAQVWKSMNRFGGADLLSNEGARDGLNARHGRHFDLTHPGERPHRVCPLEGGVIAIALHDILDDGLLPSRT